MLGLREEVHRDPVGIGRAVADHQDLGRPGHHVDADRAEHAALRRGDVGVARADDLVDRGNGRGAVGERADRLRAADREHAVDAGELRGRKHQRVPLAVAASARTMTSSPTPATFAGSAFISTDEG